MMNQMWKKLLKTMAVLVLVMLAVLMIPGEAKADQTFRKDSNGVTYIYDSDGSLCKEGFYQINGKWYYAASDGSREESSWVYYKSNWYYLKQDGVMAESEWITHDGCRYYFKSWGGMYANTWANLNGIYYYFRSWGGAYQNCFANINGNTYYFQDDCSRAPIGWIQVNGNWYYVRNDGSISKKEWISYKNCWYYLKDDGLMASSEWLYYKDNWYYFKSWGGMYASEWLEYKGCRYYFKSWGGMVTGWNTIGSATYYFYSWGGMARSTTIDGYEIDANGVRGNRVQGSKKVCINAGHQHYGNSSKEQNGPGSSTMKAKCTSGTAGNVTGLWESELNLKVALKVKELLLQRGYEVYMIRESQEVDISNKERCQLATANGCDIMVSIHGNSVSDTSVYGALTMAPTTSNPYLSTSLVNSSRLLAQTLIDTFCGVTGAKNRGIQSYDTMTSLNWMTMPTCIIEMGFMSNADEDRLMATDAYQNKMAKGIADGIDAYFAKAG